MIRIPGDASLEGRIHQKATDQIRAHRGKSKEHAHLWEKALQKSARRLGAADWLKFQVLHRQFQGKRVPGLPTAVSAGRFLVKSIGRFRGRA